MDEDFFEELEENLILSDMGMDTTMEAVEELRSRVKERKIKDPEEVNRRAAETREVREANGDTDASKEPAGVK